MDARIREVLIDQMRAMAQELRDQADEVEMRIERAIENGPYDRDGFVDEFMGALLAADEARDVMPGLIETLVKEKL